MNRNRNRYGHNLITSTSAPAELCRGYNMTQEELDKIVEQHQHWLKRDREGWEHMKADLRGAGLSGARLDSANLSGANLYGINLDRADLHSTDLRGADLREANLHGVDLSDVNLCGANLRDANLSGANLNMANLSRADLYWANLHEADLRGTNLSGADLREVDLSWADLIGADLRGADLRGADLGRADLYGTNLSVADKFRLGQILTEPLTGYKKTKEGVVISAEIPAGAIVFSINGSKCRTNKAKITDMDGREVLHSQYDPNFEYRLGQEININDFNLMYNVECASGFHFFRTREEAEEY